MATQMQLAEHRRSRFELASTRIQQRLHHSQVTSGRSFPEHKRPAPNEVASAPRTSRKRASFTPPSTQMSRSVAFTCPPLKASSRASRSILRAGRSNWSTRSCAMPGGMHPSSSSSPSGSPPPARVWRQVSWKRLPGARRSSMAREQSAARSMRRKFARHARAASNRTRRLPLRTPWLRSD